MARRREGVYVILIIGLTTAILQLATVINVFTGLTEAWLIFASAAIGYAIRLIQSPSPQPAISASPNIEGQRTEYERGIQIEISNILTMIKEDANRGGVERPKKILSNRWDEPTDERKVELIGVAPFHLLKSSYEQLEAINDYLDKSSGLLGLQELRPMQREYLKRLKKACNNIPWLKSLEGKCDEVLASLQYSV